MDSFRSTWVFWKETFSKNLKTLESLAIWKKYEINFEPKLEDFGITREYKTFVKYYTRLITSLFHAL
jgi:hypothetical protein